MNKSFANFHFFVLSFVLASNAMSMNRCEMENKVAKCAREMLDDLYAQLQKHEGFKNCANFLSNIVITKGFSKVKAYKKNMITVLNMNIVPSSCLTT